ncbi:MAG: GGDEF domain-containing protein [Rubrivivax sp.]|nr:GGDEF domain-containing protein [Rubrivivax sp.]
MSLPAMTQPDKSADTPSHPAWRMGAAALAAAAVVGGVAASADGVPWLAAAAAAVVAGLAAWRPAVARTAWPDVVGASAVPAQEASLRDPQTGMFHRAAFLALAERDWLRAGRYGGAVALMVVEVDRLRQMTEQSGPQVADALLAGLGRQVLASLRAADLLARFDDAQLAVFLPQADTTGALDVADRIRDMVEHLRLPGLPDGARFSASVGVAVLRPLHQPLSALVGLSQQALQQARHAGGNCVRSASTEGAWLQTLDELPTDDSSKRPARPGENRD